MYAMIATSVAPLIASSAAMKSNGAMAIARKPPLAPVQRLRLATCAAVPAASSLNVTAAPTAVARSRTSRLTSSIGA